MPRPAKSATPGKSAPRKATKKTPSKPTVKTTKSALPNAKETLSENQIRLIIRLFAEGRKPRDIHKVLKDEVGVTISYDLLCYYNPNYQHTELAQKWHELYAEERKKFLNEINECLGASSGVRISRLWDMAEKLREKEEFTEASEMLAQIREEIAAVGLQPTANSFVMNSTTIVSGGSLEEKKQRLAEALGIKADKLPPPAKSKKTTTKSKK